MGQLQWRMAPEISAAVTSISIAAKMLTGLRQISQDAEVGAKIIEVQGLIADLHSKLLDVQTRYSDLLQSKDELLAKLKEYQDWSAKAANYELKKLPTGSFVQALKPSAQTGEPMHYICPKCFEAHKKSVLQGVDEEALLYRCPKCKFETEPVVDSRPISPRVHLPGLRR